MKLLIFSLVFLLLSGCTYTKQGQRMENLSLQQAHFQQPNDVVSWQGPSGDHGWIRVKGSWYNKQGEYCREYEKSYYTSHNIVATWINRPVTEVYCLSTNNRTVDMGNGEGNILWIKQIKE